ncbi:MAG: porin [Gemmatales bacterium]
MILNNSSYFRLQARTFGRAIDKYRKVLATLLCLLITSTTHAQQSGTALPDQQARISQLEKEVQELKTLLQQNKTESPTSLSLPPLQEPKAADSNKPSQGAQNPPLTPETKSLFDEWYNERLKRDAEQKKAEEEKKKLTGSVVGSDTKFNVSWDNGGMRYKTADDAFNLHIGGRLMADGVWWNESPQLRQSPVQPPGSPLGQYTGVGPGIGDLQDGFFIRRARVVADGRVYQNIEFKAEFDFENYNNISFDESFIGMRDLPFADTIRIGQMHVPFGLEAFTSSRFLPMIERSPLFDAFYQEFAPGIFYSDNFLDKRITMQHMFHRIDNFSQFNGASFGDGKYAYSGRVSALPIYEDNGRNLLHLGVAYQFRTGSPPLDFNGGTNVNPSPNSDNTDLIRYRARASIRDAVGLQGDSSRMIDTGNIVADDAQSVNFELLYYLGSFWLQSETCVSHVDNAYYPANATATNRGSLNYWGSYVQVGYFLTGENRGYDKRFGKYDRVVPHENAFLIKDDCGRMNYGLGAWELVYRYSYVNLNDQTVLGGIYGEHTVGLNWYWTPNIKIQFNYVNGQRSVPEPAASGNVQAFAIQTALEF